MKAELAGGFYVVTVDEADVGEFKRSWPCSGIVDDAAFTFTFTTDVGDLVDVVATADGKPADSHDSDGPALLALSEDAGRFGAADLGLTEVVSIRWPDETTARPGL